jgi:hypothetical protein
LRGERFLTPSDGNPWASLSYDEAAMPTSSKKPLMRSLGEFVGHIVRGLRTDPATPPKKVVRTSVEQQQREDGVILRRTTIDEVEIRRQP